MSERTYYFDHAITDEDGDVSHREPVALTRDELTDFTALAAELREAAHIEDAGERRAAVAQTYAAAAAAGIGVPAYFPSNGAAFADEDGELMVRHERARERRPA